MTTSKSRTLAKKIYEGIKDKSYSRYNEEAHCVSVLEVMNSELPFLSEFCRKNNIARGTACNWIKNKKIFKNCYMVGLEYAYSNWIREGEEMKDNEEFNTGHWKHKGKVLFQIGENRRIRLNVRKDDTPYEQYKTIMESAADGDFTATELKQVMESVMVGARAFESDELAKRIDEIELDVEKGQQHHEQGIIAVEQFKKEN